MDSLQCEVERYLGVCKELKGLSDLTLKAYTIDLRQFCEYMQNQNYCLRENLLDYIDDLHKKYKPQSAKRKIACVKAFYRYMEMEDVLEENPFHKVQIKYKMPVQLPKTIPLQYVETILRYAYNALQHAESAYQKKTVLRNTIVLELLFSTGMRVSEISHLRISNIDLKGKSIRIFGKGSKERIMCIANDEIVAMLTQYINTYHKDSEFLFLNRFGNRLSEQSIRNMINSYANLAGVPLHITPHMFRHTFATTLLEEDVDIRYIQQLLGHSSIVTTQIYTHISTTKIRNILETKHPRNRVDFCSLYESNEI